MSLTKVLSCATLRHGTRRLLPLADLRGVLAPHSGPDSIRIVWLLSASPISEDVWDSEGDRAMQARR